MDLTHGMPFYSTQGSKSGGPVLYLVVFGTLIALTLLIVSFVIPNKIGPWWLWTLVTAGFIALGYFQNKRDTTSIELYKEKNNALRVRIKNSSEDTQLVFLPEAVAYWYSFEQMRAKHGGFILVKYFCVIKGTDGKELSFRQMIGGKGTEPADWPYRDESLGEGEGIYHIMAMREFINAIRR